MFSMSVKKETDRLIYFLWDRGHTVTDTQKASQVCSQAFKRKYALTDD